MLTSNEREWLTRQQELLVRALSRATINADALDAYANAGSSGLRHRRERRRLARAVRRWSDEAMLRQAVVTTWLAIHAVTTGQNRGPVMPQSAILHAANLIEKRGWVQPT